MLSSTKQTERHIENAPRLTPDNALTSSAVVPAQSLKYVQRMLSDVRVDDRASYAFRTSTGLRRALFVLTKQVALDGLSTLMTFRK